MFFVSQSISVEANYFLREFFCLCRRLPQPPDGFPPLGLNLSLHVCLLMLEG